MFLEEGEGEGDEGWRRLSPPKGKEEEEGLQEEPQEENPEISLRGEMEGPEEAGHGDEGEGKDEHERQEPPRPSSGSGGPIPSFPSYKERGGREG